VEAFLRRPELIPEGFSRDAYLPYELTSEDIEGAMNSSYDVLHEVNSALVRKGYWRLEELLLTNAFAGFLSEILVKNIAERSKMLTRNIRIGGHPDLIPKNKYPNNSVLRGEGIEVKASRQKGGWQGHNPEKGWLIVFRYSIDNQTKPIQDRRPTEFLEVLAAELDLDDWSFSGRGPESRRTITASVTRKGVEKLRSNTIYRKATVLEAFRNETR